MKNQTTMQIEEILENFDFDRVYKVMQHLDWKWDGDEVPNHYQLIRQARKLLEEAVKYGYNNHHEVSMGGFKATFDNGDLTLEFIVDKYTSYKDN